MYILIYFQYISKFSTILKCKYLLLETNIEMEYTTKHDVKFYNKSILAFVAASEHGHPSASLPRRGEYCCKDSHVTMPSRKRRHTHTRTHRYPHTLSWYVYKRVYNWFFLEVLSIKWRRRSPRSEHHVRKSWPGLSRDSLMSPWQLTTTRYSRPLPRTDSVLTWCRCYR